MSWLSRSLANSLRLDSADDAERNPNEMGSQPTPTAANEEAAIGGDQNPGRGVKEDLSELTQTLTRQLWGVASFLAPPPPSCPNNAADTDCPPQIITGSAPSSARASGSDRSASDSQHGVLFEFPNIGGGFRNGKSKLSSNKGRSTFLLPFGSEDDGMEYASGRGIFSVTEEVLAFARNISMHPETWLDYPLLPDEDEPDDDFDMSDAQQEHALAIEYLVPRLAALRIELCPIHMSEGCFWKIYFVLLHPRLHKEDAEYLSTPQIVEARAMMLQELQNRMKSDYDRFGRSTSYRKDSTTSATSSEQHLLSGGTHDIIPLKTQTLEESMPPMSITEFETEKHPSMLTEIKILDKVLSDEQPPEQAKTCSLGNQVSIENYEDEDDGWLAEDDDVTEMHGSGIAPIPIDSDEDISFSDLEDEDDCNVPSSSRGATQTINQIKDSRDLVRMHFQ